MRAVGFAILALGCAFGAPPMAWAETFKCVRSDGSTSFQDRPCPPGATSRAIKVAPAAGPPPPAGATAARPSPADTVRDFDRQRLDQETRARNDETAAFNKMQRCNVARQQLGVLQDGRRVFRRDDAGERHYVDDADRGGETSAAQRRVADACS